MCYSDLLTFEFEERRCTDLIDLGIGFFRGTIECVDAVFLASVSEYLLTLVRLWTSYFGRALAWRNWFFCVFEVETPFRAFLLDYSLAHGFQFPQEKRPVVIPVVGQLLLRSLHLALV